MIELFNTVLYQPLFNLLIWLYNMVGQDIGLAIIALTVLIKLVLYPFSLKAIKAQKELSSLQPKIEELKKKYKDQKDVMSKELMKLYQENKINPLSSCLPILVQLPILIAVYQVFMKGLGSEGLENLYPFIANPGHINAVSFGFLDLSKSNIVLAVLAGLAQFWQARQTTISKPAIKSSGSKDESVTAMMNKQMLYFMPLITVVIGASLPGGLTLYWFLTTFLTVLQQSFHFRKGKEDKKENDEKEELNTSS